jgi:hypothetical protein
MNLNDLRKYAIRRQANVSFRLSSGMECIVDRQGVARVPALDRPAAFSLEQELATASEFQVEMVSSAPKTARRTCSRTEMEQLAAAEPHAAEASNEHDE